MRESVVVERGGFSGSTVMLNFVVELKVLRSLRLGLLMDAPLFVFG
jgi:hypothetical protein